MAACLVAGTGQLFRATVRRCAARGAPKLLVATSADGPAEPDGDRPLIDARHLSKLVLEVAGADPVGDHDRSATWQSQRALQPGVDLGHKPEPQRGGQRTTADLGRSTVAPAGKPVGRGVNKRCVLREAGEGLVDRRGGLLIVETIKPALGRSRKPLAAECWDRLDEANDRLSLRERDSDVRRSLPAPAEALRYNRRCVAAATGCALLRRGRWTVDDRSRA